MDNKYLNKKYFYSQNWERADGFRSNNPPTYDILIIDGFLHVISLPEFGLLRNIIMMPAISSGLIGALTIRHPIVNSYEKKVNEFRSKYVDLDLKVVSTEYENDVFLKIPDNTFSKSIKYKNNIYGQKLCVFEYADKKITLRVEKDDYEKFVDYIKSCI